MLAYIALLFHRKIYLSKKRSFFEKYSRFPRKQVQFWSFLITKELLSQFKKEKNINKYMEIFVNLIALLFYLKFTCLKNGYSLKKTAFSPKAISILVFFNHKGAIKPV